MELKYINFYSVEILIEFIKRNNIDKENIQSITYNTDIRRYSLFYWK